MNTDALRQLYADYLEQAHSLERNRRLGEGLFGFGRRPADDPCHELFVKAVSETMLALAEEQDAATVAEAMRWICDAPLMFPDEPPSIYWVLMAAHGGMLAGISSLGIQDAKALYDHYDLTWPREKRMPLQQQVHKALKKAAGC